MSVTAATVREKLKSIKGPEGVDLAASGKLSDIVVTDGKVFFSLSVDAAQAQAWEEVRKNAEAAVGNAVIDISRVTLATEGF